MAEAMEKELCYYCKLPFTIDQLLNHQLKCNTSQDYDCFSCGKKIKLSDTWEHECEIYHEERVERNQTKLCVFCGNQIQKNYYDQHAIDCLHRFENEWKEVMEKQKNIIMDQKQSLTFLNMTNNNILNSLATVNKQINALTKRMDNMGLEIKEFVNKNTFEKILNNVSLEMKEFVNKSTFEKELKLYDNILNYNKNINDKFMSDNLIIELDQMDLRLQSNEAYHTQPSYTVDGYFYRFKIFGYSNQEDKMGIYFQLIQSPKDHSLKWPFMKTVTCTVKNEYIENTKIIANYSEPLKECFEKPAQAYNRAIGTDSFITHEQLKKFYIKNNKLIIHVSFI
nr:uncharacterized protein LOC124807775 isoform X1 [Hydra vulgaris]